MEWISVKKSLPNLPIKNEDTYLVCVKKKDCPTRIRFAKWRRRLHRRQETNESTNDVLRKSTIARWWLPNYKSSEITYWMPVPLPPKDQENA